MIAELFLACAMSLPATQFRPTLAGHSDVLAIKLTEETDVDIKLRPLRLSARFLDNAAHRKHRTSGRTLIINHGDPRLVARMREQGFDAFGLITVFQEKTPYHVVGKADEMPFQHEAFYLVYWLTEVIGEQIKTSLWDVARTIEPLGFFIFNTDLQEGFERLLEAWGWDRLPFKIDNYSVWQKPAVGSVGSLKRNWSFKSRIGSLIPIGEAIHRGVTYGVRLFGVGQTGFDRAYRIAVGSAA